MLFVILILSIYIIILIMMIFKVWLLHRHRYHCRWRAVGTVDWDTVASNCSTGSCFPNFNKRMDELEKLELRNLSSMRDSNRIIPPSEYWACMSFRPCLSSRSYDEGAKFPAPNDAQPLEGLSRVHPSGESTRRRPTSLWGTACRADSSTRTYHHRGKLFYPYFSQGQQNEV